MPAHNLCVYLVLFVSLAGPGILQHHLRHTYLVEFYLCENSIWEFYLCAGKHRPAPGYSSVNYRKEYWLGKCTSGQHGDKACEDTAGLQQHLSQASLRKGSTWHDRKSRTQISAGCKAFPAPHVCHKPLPTSGTHSPFITISTSCSRGITEAYLNFRKNSKTDFHL